VTADALAWLDGIAVADLVRRREVGVAEVVESAISRIEHLDPALGFLIAPMFEQARALSAGPPAGGPLAGVPMLLKDHLATHAGVVHTSGSRFLRDHVAAADSELVARYKRAGLIPLGTTATCEFALLSTAETARYGPCRNPWDLERTTGGSSGGSAAAVAAGAVPIAHANDSGGSIRIPASCCGLFGLKPTRARNTLGPAYGDLSAGIWAEHVVTRSVRDSAAALDATAGPMPGDPYGAPPAQRPFLAEVGADPGRLRIAVFEEPLTAAEVHPDCRAAVRDAARLCESLGHFVETARLPVDGGRLEDAYFVIYTAGAAWRLDAWERQLGRRAGRDELEPSTWVFVERGRQQSAAGLLAAVKEVKRSARQIAGFHERFDVTLSPTLAAPPVPLGHFSAAPESVVEVDAAFSPYTWIANATGQPAMSVPLYWSEDGLPIGTHFTAALGREDVLLRLAAQLEAARPWAGRRAPAAHA
jgi:amidase